MISNYFILITHPLNRKECKRKSKSNGLKKRRSNEIKMPYNRPFSELKTQALARNPIPTAAKPQPEISLYLKAPKPINSNPITTINKVAHPKMVFLFIPIIVVLYYFRGANIAHFYS